MKNSNKVSAPHYIYTFPSVPGLTADMDGRFLLNGTPPQKTVNNGCLALKIGSRRIGIATLRKQAKKEVYCPF